MKVDYFGDLLRTVPSGPGSEKQTGDGEKPYGSSAPPVFPVSPAISRTAGKRGFFNHTEQTTTPLLSCCRATSYPCGKCGGKYYTQNQDGWQCDGCAVVFKIIGGTRGPEIIH